MSRPKREIVKNFSKALLIGSGGLVSPEQVRELARDRFLVAVDGGLGTYLQVNITPHLLVGDLDSVSESEWRNFQMTGLVLRYPVHKDKLDLVVACRWLIRRGFTDLSILGWSDERIDYGLGLLWELATLPARISLLTARACVHVLNEFRPLIELSSSDSTRVSIFPLSTQVSLVSEGLRWELSWQDVSPPTHSQSNELLQTSARIARTKGQAFVVAAR